DFFVAFEAGKLLFQWGLSTEVDEVSLGFHALDAIFKMFETDQGAAGVATPDPLLGAVLSLGVNVAPHKEAVPFPRPAELILKLSHVSLVLFNERITVRQFLLQRAGPLTVPALFH